jgi:hypothetical protein
MPSVSNITTYPNECERHYDAIMSATRGLGFERRELIVGRIYSFFDAAPICVKNRRPYDPRASSVPQPS